jgi:hypothetical protein
MPNIFGGKNANGLYVPMSEDEQEILDRLISSDDLKIVIEDWGYVNTFNKILLGDARLGLSFRMSFTKPEIPMEIKSLTLILQTKAGLTLFKKTEPINLGNNQGLFIKSGDYLDFCWDIQIKAIDPKLAKQIKPGLLGLTSRRFDKDTGSITRTGNMKTNNAQKLLLEKLQKSEDFIKQVDKALLMQSNKI